MKLKKLSKGGYSTLDDQFHIYKTDEGWYWIERVSEGEYQRVDEQDYRTRKSVEKELEQVEQYYTKENELWNN